MKEIDLLQKLLELLNESNAGAIEVRKNLWSTTIKVSKNSFPSHGGPVTYQVAAAAPPESANPVAPVAPAAPAAPAAEAAAAPHLTDITAPMVGTFYAQPEPGAEPYVHVGSRIRPGTTLCIVEAMKIMNPIDAEISGVIKEICVKDAQPVEFGQALFRVDAND
jgi:acetyl-CoA carboxylase biotin carboxyl carrier protein